MQATSSCIVTVLQYDQSLQLHFRIKVNCEVMPLRSFPNFKLAMSHDRNELSGAPNARGPRPWAMRKSVTECHCIVTPISTSQHSEEQVSPDGIPRVYQDRGQGGV